MQLGLNLHTAIVTAALALALPAGAWGAELQTWETQSRYVDPAREQFNGPPPGAPERPNALRVNVLLPDGYDGRRRFPVLYLLHGHGDAFDHWANPERGDVAAVADGLNAIVVMPEGARGWYVNWWKGGQRADPAWERYHLEELLPLVERRLRIRPGRRWHAIAGLSMGGLGALYYASQRPDYFGAAASFSGAISIQRPAWPTLFDSQGERHQDVYGDPQAQAFYWSAHNPTALTANLEHTRVYVTVGDGTPFDPGNAFGALAEIELRQHAEDFLAAARASGVPVTYAPLAGIHDWPYWRRHLADAIAWGPFDRAEESPSRWSYRTASRRGTAWQLGFELAEEPSGPFALAREGTVLRGSGSGRVAITTGDGCPLAAELPFERALPHRAWVRTIPTLRLRAKPRRAIAGRRKRFHFRVTSLRCGRREPVAGATVRFGRRRARTRRDGSAAMRLRPRGRGRRVVRASKRGYRASVTAIAVVPPRGAR